MVSIISLKRLHPPFNLICLIANDIKSTNYIEYWHALYLSENPSIQMENMVSITHAMYFEYLGYATLALDHLTLEKYRIVDFNIKTQVVETLSLPRLGNNLTSHHLYASQCVPLADDLNIMYDRTYKRYHYIDTCRTIPSFYLTSSIYAHLMRMEFYQMYIKQYPDHPIGSEDARNYFGKCISKDQKVAIEQRYTLFHNLYTDTLRTFISTLYNDMMLGKRFLSHIKSIPNDYLCQLFHEKGIKYCSLPKLYALEMNQMKFNDTMYTEFRQAMLKTMQVEIVARTIKVDLLYSLMDRRGLNLSDAKDIVYRYFDKKDHKTQWESDQWTTWIDSYIWNVKQTFAEHLHSDGHTFQMEVPLRDPRDTAGPNTVVISFSILHLQRKILNRLKEISGIRLQMLTLHKLIRDDISFVVRKKAPYSYYIRKGIHYKYIAEEEVDMEEAKLSCYLLSHKYFNKGNLMGLRREKYLIDWGITLFEIYKRIDMNMYVSLMLYVAIPLTPFNRQLQERLPQISYLLGAIEKLLLAHAYCELQTVLEWIQEKFVIQKHKEVIKRLEVMKETFKTLCFPLYIIVDNLCNKMAH